MSQGKPTAVGTQFGIFSVGDVTPGTHSAPGT